MRESEREGTVVFDDPPWLLAAVDQLLQRIEDAVDEKLLGLAALTGAVLVVALTQPGPDQAEKVWDESCDRCGAYVPGQLHDGISRRQYKGMPLQIHFGVCHRCLEEVTGR